MKINRITHCQTSAMVVCRASGGMQSNSGQLTVSTHTPQWPITKRQTAFLRRVYKCPAPCLSLGYLLLYFFFFFYPQHTSRWYYTKQQELHNIHWIHALFKTDMFCFSVSLRPQKPSGLLGTGNPGWPPRLPYSSWTLRARVQCCFTTTETIRPVRDGEPRTATSTFTQLLNSEGPRSVLLYDHRNHKAC